MCFVQVATSDQEELSRFQEEYGQLKQRLTMAEEVTNRAKEELKESIQIIHQKEIRNEQLATQVRPHVYVFVYIYTGTVTSQ